MTPCAGGDVRVVRAILLPAIAQRRLPLIGGLLLCFFVADHPVSRNLHFG